MTVSFPLLIPAIAAHVSVMTAYHYLQSPLLGAVAFVSTIYELYRLVSK